jgi:F-type H+-transporting ATPase subunit delta
MAEIATLARPYAEAVFQIAKEETSFDVWSENLDFLMQVIGDPFMIQVIKNPLVSKEELRHVLLDVCNEKISTGVGQNLIKLLLDNGRLDIIPQLVQQYEQLKAEHLGYVKVDIISTYTVESHQLQTIEAVLKERLGKAVDIVITVDRNLIGGWLVRIGDQVIDMSIKGRLQQLATELRR